MAFHHFLGVLLAGLGKVLLVFDSFASLVPPPLVNLLLAHLKILFVFGSHDLDAVTSPHEIFLKFVPQDFQFPFCLTLAFAKQIFEMKFGDEESDAEVDRTQKKEEWVLRLGRVKADYSKIQDTFLP